MALPNNIEKKINALPMELDRINLLPNQPRIIKVFLASSDELKQDRIAFGDLIRRLDSIYEKRGVRIKLKKWEDFDAAYNGRRKQDDYNDYVRDSEMFLALFYKKAGKYTIEEFDVALKEYKRTGVKPKIYVFCQDLKENEQESDNLKKYKARLDNNLGYFWGHYNNSDSLHLNFVMQLLLFENSLADIFKVENGEVTIDGFPVASMDRLSFVTKNSDYQRINRRLKELSILIENDRLEVDKHPDNKDLRDDLQDHIDEKNDLQDKLVQQQNLLFETAKRINCLQVSAITERMKKAIDAFESGDAHQANIILNETEYDADRNLTDYLQNREKAILSIEELLLKASVCLCDTSIDIESRVDKVRNLYIKADKMAQMVGYEKSKHALLLIGFVDFSLKYGHYDDALNYGNRQIQLSEELYGDSNVKITPIYNLMGLVYCDMGNYDKAKEFLLKATAIREKELGPNHPDTACSYNNLAEVYRKHKDFRKALDYYIRASDVYLKIQVSPFAIATLLNNIGLVYYELNDCDKALRCYFSAYDRCKKTLGEEHDIIANVLHNVGMTYLKQGNNEDAMTYLNKAKDIFLSKLGPNHPNTKKSQKWIDYAKGKM